MKSIGPFSRHLGFSDFFVWHISQPALLCSALIRLTSPFFKMSFLLEPTGVHSSNFLQPHCAMSFFFLQVSSLYLHLPHLYRLKYYSNYFQLCRECVCRESRQCERKKTAEILEIYVRVSSNSSLRYFTLVAHFRVLGTGFISGGKLRQVMSFVHWLNHEGGKGVV